MSYVMIEGNRYELDKAEEETQAMLTLYLLGIKETPIFYSDGMQSPSTLKQMEKPDASVLILNRELDGLNYDLRWTVKRTKSKEIRYMISNKSRPYKFNFSVNSIEEMDLIHRILISVLNNTKEKILKSF